MGELKYQNQSPCSSDTYFIKATKKLLILERKSSMGTANYLTGKKSFSTSKHLSTKVAWAPEKQVYISAQVFPLLFLKFCCNFLLSIPPHNQSAPTQQLFSEQKLQFWWAAMCIRGLPIQRMFAVNDETILMITNEKRKPYDTLHWTCYIFVPEGPNCKEITKKKKEA